MEISCLPTYFGRQSHKSRQAMDRPEAYLTVTFRERTFRAVPEYIHGDRSHVCILHMPSPSAGLLCFRWLVSHFPRRLRDLLRQRVLPAWFIPDTFFLKQRNPTRADDYPNELFIYRHLGRLDCVTRLFGPATVRGPHGTEIPALLLELVLGTTLCDIPLEDRVGPEAREAISQGRDLEINDKVLDDELKEALDATYEKLTQAGVRHGDFKLDNLIRREDGTIVAVDFEFASLLERGEADIEGLRTVLYGICHKVKDAARRRRLRHDDGWDGLGRFRRSVPGDSGVFGRRRNGCEIDGTEELLMKSKIGDVAGGLSSEACW